MDQDKQDSKGNWWLWIAYASSAATVAVLIAFGADEIPHWALGAGLIVYLGIVGMVFFKTREVHNSGISTKNNKPNSFAHVVADLVRNTGPFWRDIMPCYLSVQDKNLKIIETNNLFEKDFGKGIGKYCYKAYKNRDEPCPDCPVLKTFETGKNHSAKETVQTQSGEQNHVVVNSAPLFDENHDIVAVVEMSTNITEVENLQNDLRQRQQYFKQLFNVVPCYITVHSSDFQIIETNELFRKDFGDKRGHQCYMAYKDRKDICPECPVKKTFADGQIHSSEENVITRDGREVDIVVHSMPIHDQEGNIASVMEVSTNITEVKRLQQELSMMGLAVAGMAHRIKNILMGLEGGIFVLNTGFETEDSEMVQQGWQMVKRNVGKVSRIVKDLLFCAKKRKPQLENDVFPPDIMKQVYNLYYATAEEDGIELKLQIDDNCAPGKFDPDGVHNLIANLVANALDACRFDYEKGDKNHTITMSCKQDREQNTIVEVSDNGPGIPEDVRDEVFKSFFSTKGTEGTGLGLLVVQKVVHEHGATISFTSQKEKGTSFRIVFPHIEHSDTSPKVADPKSIESRVSEEKSSPRTERAD